MPLKPLVLAVDNEPLNLEIIEELLEEGYRVVTALSGLESLQQVARERPDIILLDVSMPEMSGFEVCQRLKKDAATATIPILYLSAFSRAEEIERGLKTGVEGYICKPFREDELLTAVQNCLNRITVPKSG